MRLVALTLGLIAACSFDKPLAPEEGPGADEADLVLDSAAELKDAAQLGDTVVYEDGVIEPEAWLAGRLLAEIDNGDAAPFGSWAMRPARAAMDNVGLLTPSFVVAPPGAPSDGFVVWFSGEVRLDDGAQKLAVMAGATAFADILDAQGTVLASCNQGTTCDLTAATKAGWYPIRFAWKRPAGQPVDFQLQWAASGSPTLIPFSRLRARTSDPQLAGWRLEGYEAPRSTLQVPNAFALNYQAPFQMDWTVGLLNLQNGNPSYRNVGQLRISKAATYEFEVTAALEAAYRLWIDGEWLTMPARWDPQSGMIRTERVSKELAAGWHDVVLEGYEHAGRSNNLKLTFGEMGQPLLPPAPGSVRPVLGLADAVASSFNGIAQALADGTPTASTITLNSLGAPAPAVTTVDVSFQLNPKVWAGMTAKLYPPNDLTGAGIPLTIDVSELIDDTFGEIHATLPGSMLTGAPVSGTWKLEVTPAAGGGNDGADNRLTKARINVHYRGTPALGAPTKIIAETATYSRMIVLDGVHELRGLLETSIEPAGSSAELTVQKCNDAEGTDCEASKLSNDELAATKPMTQYARVNAIFTSDGFAVPGLDKITLRYRK